MWAARVAPLLVVFLAAPGQAAPPTENEALVADEECHESDGRADDGTCAVNQLQVRATMKLEQGPVLAQFVHPVYCQLYAEQTKGSPMCTGAKTCKCEGYCSTQAADAKGYDPNCCGCGDAVMPKNPPQMPAGGMPPGIPGMPYGVPSGVPPGFPPGFPGAVPMATGVPPKQEMGAAPPAGPAPPAGAVPSGVGPLEKPKYCYLAAQAMSSPPCAAATACKCEGYCSAQPATARGWDPTCCACPEKLALVEEEAQVSANFVHPVYCQLYAEQTKGSPMCAGAKTCKCEGYCSTQAADAKGYDPNCCGCGDAVMPKNPPQMPAGGMPPGMPYGVPSGVPPGFPPGFPGVMPMAPGVPPKKEELGAAPQGGVAPPAGAGPADVGPIEKPKYCYLAAEAMSSPPCAAAAACKCEGYCKTQPATARGWDPTCCSCPANM